MKNSKIFYLLLFICVVLLSFILYQRWRNEKREEMIWEKAELYLADYNSPGGPFLVPVSIKIQRDDVLASAMELLINPPIYIQKVSSPLPKGSRLLSAEVKGDTAYINFSKELRDNFAGGSTNEMLVIYGIVNTACSLRGINRVQILIEGQAIDSLGGHLDISRPLEPDKELVKNE